jgi:hypothetical protein
VQCLQRTATLMARHWTLGYEIHKAQDTPAAHSPVHACWADDPIEPSRNEVMSNMPRIPVICALLMQALLVVSLPSQQTSPYDRIMGEIENCLPENCPAPLSNVDQTLISRFQDFIHEGKLLILPQTLVAIGLPAGGHVQGRTLPTNGPCHEKGIQPGELCLVSESAFEQASATGFFADLDPEDPCLPLLKIHVVMETAIHELTHADQDGCEPNDNDRMECEAYCKSAKFLCTLLCTHECYIPALRVPGSVGAKLQEWACQRLRTSNRLCSFAELSSCGPLCEDPCAPL